ncbi:alpha/beta fold hydrolase [Streptomyces sp. NPDC051041]|uniref:S9 family peptidase n=1 Tax=Streptomyces sp. NPDC051041 TaxID=3365640 RepID=UPI003789CE55
MTALAPPTAVRTRFGFTFSAHGTHLACLAVDDAGRSTPELWSLTGGTPRRQPLPAAGDGDSPRTQCLPTDDGRLLLCRSGSGRHELLTDAPDGVRPLGTVHHPALRLLPCPGPDGLALLVGTDTTRRSTVWRLTGPGPRLEEITRLPGVLLGGTWLDDHGSTLAGVLYGEDGTRSVVLDTATGATGALPGTVPGERLLLACPRSGLLVTAVPADGPYRLALRPADGSRPPRYPEGLNALPGSVRPLALAPDGRRLAVRSDRGAVSDLLVHDLDADRTTVLPGPAGTLREQARWTGSGLHLVRSTPDRPIGPVTVQAVTARAGAAATGPRADHPVVRTLEFAGADGPLEAVVHGDPRTWPHTVLALHGGPETAWHLEYDPLLHDLTAAGIAVVALNQRGSTGYGTAHRDAIRGDWGGADLADVRQVGRQLADHRSAAGLEPPSLYGNSYGAWLALLAAADTPRRWARCAVVAPFLSVPRLHAAASPGVRALLARLAAPVEGESATGRDVWRLADRLRTPLLVVHGDRDDVVPVGQSRDLRDRLTALGRRPGIDFAYREVPGAGHYPPGGSTGPAVRETITDFLRTGAF